MTVLVTGGTGNVGVPLLDAVAGRDDVRALVVNQEGAAMARAHGATPVIGDLRDASSLGEAFTGVDTVFLLSPFFQGHEALEHNALDAAERAGVRRIVKLAYSGLDWPIALTAGHREIRDRLADSPFDVTLLLSDIYASNILAQAESIASGQLVLPGANAHIAYTDPADVGEVAAHLLTVDAPINDRVYVSGPELLSNSDAAAIAGRSFGTDAVYVEAPADLWTESLVKAGWPRWVAESVAEMHTTVSEKGPLPVADATERYLGRPAHPLTEFLARVRQG